MFRPWALVLLVPILLLSFTPVLAAPSPAIPLSSWVYPALDKLTGLGLIESSLQGNRPFSRAEAARQTDEATQRSRDAQVAPVARELLARLQQEFHHELGELQNPETPAASYFKPIREMRLDYLYREGADSPYPQTNASQFALLTNRDGLDYRTGHNSELTLVGDARWGRWLSVDWRPLVRLQEGDGASLRFRQGVVALGLGPVQLSAGRQPLWWGQGRHGSLVLSNNADPLDLVRLHNPSPVELPWILKYLGPFQFDMFAARLDNDREVPRPWFGGLRIGFKPWHWLELGMHRTVMFGGKGRPDIGFDDFLTIIGGQNLSGDDDTSNSLAALDFRLKLPFLWNAELYGEYGGEDEAKALGILPFVSKTAYLAGIYLPQIEPSGRLGLRLEYTDTNRNNAWYRHGIYRSGYTYEKKILGHHLGGTGRGYFAELSAYLNEGLSLSLSFHHADRTPPGLPSERHYQPALELSWQYAPEMLLRLRYACDRVHNFAFQDNDSRTLHLAEAGLAWSW
ncbi:capsule assembly Wzi family protein [Desulfuromonas sp. CSMB_57]|jgi:hypothetical protein|uniref:capsule assembly Wzi family protein n=1 Tax=Desulfuromonas sp. CSMB_57 TaxID=2807629 RepID=UPI001CD34A5B|nr:capsule assembly Wzi family protein [Desulfuromonas sp. CSMB_57]